MGGVANIIEEISTKFHDFRSISKGDIQNRANPQTLPTSKF